MIRTFHVKNFERFQHYKDRSPPWIKLYNELLDDYEFGCLQDASKLHLVLIWLLASRSDNKIPYDARWVAKRINATEPVNLEALEKAGFIISDQPLQSAVQDASKALAECLTRERGEAEAEAEENPVPNGTGAEAPNLEALVYRRGKEILGPSAGGQITKLRKAMRGDDPAILALMNEAKEKKGDAKQWLSGVIKKRCAGTDAMGLPLPEPYDVDAHYRSMGVEGFA